MADSEAPAKPPTAAIGYTQQPLTNWWLYDAETTPELQWPQSVYVYDQMRRTDSQCKAVLKAVMLPVLRTPWRIDPAGARPEVVQLVADDLGLPIMGQPLVIPARQRDRFSWTEHVRLALLSLVFGHSFFEQVYRVDDDGSMAHLAKLEYRPPTTIERIDVAKDGGLVAIKQHWTQIDRTPQPIPVSRLVAYVNEREGGNWLGTSLLRAAYKNWLLKDRLLRVQAQTIERNGMGIPIYEGAENEASLAPGLGMATSLRSGEAAGAATPYGAKLRLMGVEGTLPNAKPAIDYHDDAIARAVLAHFLNLGTQTGSWALGSTFADFFTLSLQTVAQFLADTATDHIVEDLVDVNWGPDEPAPRLCFDEIGSRQQATAESLAALVNAGLLTPDPTLEGATRQFYGLPPASPEGETAAPEDTAPDASGSTVVTDTPTETGTYSVAAAEGVDLDDESSWIAAAAGVDTHPGGERLKRYWLFGAGAAKWATWTELFDHLRKYIPNTALLKRTVSKWYFLRYGHTPPHHKGVHAAAVTDSAEALAAYAEMLAELEPDDNEADEWLEQIDALTVALDELSSAVVASFNPRQPRIPPGQPGGGRFMSMVENLKAAIEDHRKRGASGHPFASFDREQLRRVARKRGISLSRNESKDSIAAKLLSDIDDGKRNARADKMAERQSTAGQKAAGVGVKPESPAKKARRERIEKATNDALEKATNDALDEADRRDAQKRWAVTATGEAALASAPIEFTYGTITGADLPDWTDEEFQATIDALDDYTADGYEFINGSLRKGHAGPRLDHTTEAIDRAMSASRLAEPVVVHRGIKSGPAVFGDAWSSDSVVGLTWKDLGYTSTTADPSVARDATSDLADSVTMRVLVPSGTSALRLSDIPTGGPKVFGSTDFEAELLLQRGLTFRVVADHGYDEKLKTRKLDVEVVST